MSGARRKPIKIHTTIYSGHVTHVYLPYASNNMDLSFRPSKLQILVLPLRYQQLSSNRVFFFFFFGVYTPNQTKVMRRPRSLPF